MKQKKSVIILTSLTLFLLTSGCIKVNHERNLKKTIYSTPINKDISSPTSTGSSIIPVEAKKNTDKTKALYEKLKLENKLDYKIFKLAMNGLEIINPPLKNYLAIVDFTKDSTKNRFFLIDLVNENLVYYELVAHGKNTGGVSSRDFSNEINSLKSSLGFYLTAEPYYGSNGYSLRLDGLDKGLNDNARERAIVLHGAPYVSESQIAQTGRLGRSWGCPAVKDEIAKDIINKLKGGNLLFHYAKGYEEKSTVLNNS